MSSTLDIVVARYNEDISWLEPLYEHCLVYDKGSAFEDYTTRKIKRVSSIPNIGREADTYLRYIIENYDSLPNYVFFTQGKVVDHVPNINDIYLLLRALIDGKESIDYHSFTILPNKLREMTIMNFIDPIHKLPLRQCWAQLFKKSTLEFKTNYNAIFVVSKERILFRSIEFYKRAWKISLMDEGAYILERFWNVIFDGSTCAVETAT
jgi:hypothetical protein